jgi:hypothetical protein
MRPFLHKGWLMSLFACRTCQEQVAWKCTHGKILQIILT